MTSLEGPTLVHTSITVERDDAKHRVERRQTTNAVSRKQVANARQYKHHMAEVNSFSNPLAVEVAPKWRRHQEDYINPHLLPHERDPIAPRYGPDLVCKRLRPTNDGQFKCSCEWCVPAGHLRVQDRRETDMALRKVVASPVSGRARVGNAGKGPWVDWDWNGQNDPNAWVGDEIQMALRLDRLGYQGEKRAPAPTIDLLSMAKPAKVKKRVSRAAPGPSPHKLALARAFLEPVVSGSGGLRDIDEISILDFEETWEHLDLDRLDLGTDDGERGSEWEWERFSQF